MLAQAILAQAILAQGSSWHKSAQVVTPRIPSVDRRSGFLQWNGKGLNGGTHLDQIGNRSEHGGSRKRNITRRVDGHASYANMATLPKQRYAASAMPGVRLQR